MEILAYAFPVFLILIGLEAFSLRANMNYKYRLNESLSNLSCGVFDQIINAFIGVIFIGVFAIIQINFGFFNFNPRSVLHWLLLLIAIDLTYYIFHRASHRINFLWATHVVHHQSEGYNLTVSLRQGTIATWVTYMFYLPLALIGFPAFMFLIVHGIFQLYQFIVHTHYLKSIGPFEKIIASPRLHRVHHGQNQQYWDKNYGGLFIIWDKLFNSYKEPKEKIIYGITTGLRSWDPFWANIYYFKFLSKSVLKLKTFSDKIRFLFGPPGELQRVVPPPKYSYGYDSQIQKEWRIYGILQLLFSIITGFFLVLYFNKINYIISIPSAFIILL